MKRLADFMRALFARGIRPMLSWTWKTSWTGYVNTDIENFVTKIRPPTIAMEASTGIPWRFAATQAAHESRYGLSKLTVEANNLFGMTAGSWVKLCMPLYDILTKEHSKKPIEFWNAPSRYFDTPGDIRSFQSDGAGGTWLTVARQFRKYSSWEQSIDDWANHIKSLYPMAYDAAKSNDFTQFAQSLQNEGYATDPHYAESLIGVYNGFQSLT